jgi:DNA-binding response OmpR family regulator
MTSTTLPFENMRALIAVEDGHQRGYLADNIDADGATVYTASTIDDTLRLAKAMPDLQLVIASLNGRTITAVRMTAERPCVMCIAEDEHAIERLLAHGADDVVRPDVGYSEIRARLVAILRRSNMKQHVVQRYGRVAVDSSARQATVAGLPLSLTTKEFELLRILISDPTRVFTKDELLEKIWGWGEGKGRSRTLDSHACRLRSKMQEADGGLWVQNKWGVGYRLCEPAMESVAA